MTLKEWRKHVNITQEEFAILAEVSQELVSAWECGREIPPRERWDGIEKITSQPIFRLFPDAFKGHEGMGHTHGR